MPAHVLLDRDGIHWQKRPRLRCSLTAVGLDCLVKVSPLIVFPGRRRSGQEASSLLKAVCFHDSRLMLLDRLKGQLSENIPVPTRFWESPSIKAQRDTRDAPSPNSRIHTRTFFFFPPSRDQKTRLQFTGWMTNRQRSKATQTPVNNWTREGEEGRREKKSIKDTLSGCDLFCPTAILYPPPPPPEPPPLFPFFLIKRTLIWVPSPAAGKEKAACNSERPRVNHKALSARTQEKERAERESQGSLFSSQSSVRTAEPLWLNVSVFYFPLWNVPALEFLCLPVSQPLWTLPVTPQVHPE